MRKYIYYAVALVAVIVGTVAAVGGDWRCVAMCAAVFLLCVDACILFSTCCVMARMIGDDGLDDGDDGQNNNVACS